MKKLSNLLFLILVTYLMGSCTSKPIAGAKKTIIAVFVDMTEETGNRATQCSKEKLTQTLLGDDDLGYGQISFRGMNSVSLNTEEVVSFSPRMSDQTETTFGDNKNDFITSMDSIYQKYMKPAKGDSFSRLYQPICEKLNAMAAQTADKKYLIMIGDGIEYSQDGNFYKATTEALVNEKVSQMESVGVLPNSPKGLKVIFLYKPKDKKAEIMHERAMRVWKKLFDKHHISYEVKPNL